MKTNVRMLLMSGALGIASLALVPPASAQIGIMLNFSGVEEGYRDGYWDRDHHWHKWHSEDDWHRYQDSHHGHAHDYRHDEPGHDHDDGHDHDH